MTQQSRYIRAYLRASTYEQDPRRAERSLAEFAQQRGHTIAATYAEAASGSDADRPALARLLADAHPGDVLLVESIDRLSRMVEADWRALKGEIEARGLRIVALDLPTSHAGLAGGGTGDATTDRMLAAINSMMLDMLAALARKDYEQRRQRQAQGIAAAQARGEYGGRRPDKSKRQRIRDALEAGFSIRKAASVTGTATGTVQRVKREMQADRQPENA